MTKTTGLRTLAVMGTLFVGIWLFDVFAPDPPPPAPPPAPYHLVEENLGDPGFGPVRRSITIERQIDRTEIEAIVRAEFDQFRKKHQAIENVRVYAYTCDSLAVAGWGEWVAMMSVGMPTGAPPAYEFDEARYSAWP